MYDDSPGWRVMFNMLEGMFYTHPVRIDIAGTVESIQKIDKEHCLYHSFQNPY